MCGYCLDTLDHLPLFGVLHVNVLLGKCAYMPYMHVNVHACHICSVPWLFISLNCITMQEISKLYTCFCTVTCTCVCNNTTVPVTAKWVPWSSIEFRGGCASDIKAMWVETPKKEKGKYHGTIRYILWEAWVWQGKVEKTGATGGFWSSSCRI